MAEVTIIGKGNYKDSIIKTFKINIGKVVGVKASRNGYTSNKITWSSVAGASGYVVYRSTSKSGKYSRVKSITKGSTISYTNGSLTKGKTYYYKVRAYRTVGGKKVYSSYSNIKYVKVK